MSEDFKELEARLRSNELGGVADAIATLRAERDEASKVLVDAYVVLAFAFNRIHGLPRSRDSELASDIAKVRAKIEALRRVTELAALPPAIP